MSSPFILTNWLFLLGVILFSTQVMTLQIGELRPKLSADARAYSHCSKEFKGLISRWREYEAPTVAGVVQVATEEDIQQTITFANEKDAPFFARSGGHGATQAMGLIKQGIQIDLRNMSYVHIAEDGKTAKVGGGATVKQFVDALEKAGKRTVTGICECVGVSAPVLGGGHGWLQGEYGLAADQIVSARVVLPNGKAVTASEDSNPDLFWALRGAGHNFGYVAEWTYRIYDIKPEAPKWAYDILVFSGDKLEELFTLHNKMQKDQPANAIHWSYIIRPAELHVDHPVIWYGIMYDGPEDEARAYSKPLYDIEHMSVQSGLATTHELAALTFQDLDGPGCAYGLTSLRFPIGLKEFNVPAVRKVFDYIDTSFQEIPEIAGSFFVLEGYSVQAVQAIDDKSTAFPHRSDNILVTSYVQYKPDPRIDPLADKFGRELRQILLDGSDDPKHLRAYVNYANGDEDLHAVYGWDDWRLQKLRELKAKWDPENRMKYYVPIVK